MRKVTAGIEDAHKGIEIASARGGEEGVDDPTLNGEVGVGVRRALLDPTARSAGQLPGRGRGAANDLGDLVERDGEDVVEDERQALGRGQRLEDDQQREPDRIGEDGVAFGALLEIGAHDRLRQPAPRVVLAS